LVYLVRFYGVFGLLANPTTHQVDISMISCHYSPSNFKKIFMSLDAPESSAENVEASERFEKIVSPIIALVFDYDPVCFEEIFQRFGSMNYLKGIVASFLDERLLEGHMFYDFLFKKSLKLAGGINISEDDLQNPEDSVVFEVIDEEDIVAVDKKLLLRALALEEFQRFYLESKNNAQIIEKFFLYNTPKLVKLLGHSFVKSGFCAQALIDHFIGNFDQNQDTWRKFWYIYTQYGAIVGTLKDTENERIELAKTYFD